MGKTRPTKRALDAGDSAAISSISLASSFSCSQAESTPAPATQPAGLVRERKPLGDKPTSPTRSLSPPHL